MAKANILGASPKNLHLMTHFQGQKCSRKLAAEFVWHVREQSLWFWSRFLPRRPLTEENSSGYSQHMHFQAARSEFLYVSTSWAGHKFVMAWKAEQNYSVLKKSKISDFWAKELFYFAHWVRYFSHHIRHKKHVSCHDYVFSVCFGF